MRFFIIVGVATICGCAGGGPASVPAPGDGSGQSAATALRSASSLVSAAAHNPSPAPQSLCVGGTKYATTQDDEFSQDKTLNYSPALISATPQPNGAIWSSRAHFFSSDSSRNNVGTDDAYYTDPTRGLGTYSPFSLSNGALHIKAEPVPAAYATAAPLEGAHWLSGLLEGPAQTYGYIEVSAEVPDVQGSFPAGLWLLVSTEMMAEATATKKWTSMKCFA